MPNISIPKVATFFIVCINLQLCTYFDAFQIVVGNSLQNVILPKKHIQTQEVTLIIMKSHLTPLIVF